MNRMNPLKLEAYKAAHGGKLTFSTIAPKKSGESLCGKTVSITAHYAKSGGIAAMEATAPKQKRYHARHAKPRKRRKFIAPRKKRTTTPILSTPYPGALDPRSHLTADDRLKLYGADKEAMRERIFERADGRCEEVRLVPFIGRYVKTPVLSRCPNPATEWSHNRHGSNKCDCLKCGIASCTDCHRRKHSTGKETPCPSPKS